MTRQKTFKRRVRARMKKTGESYTAARRMLIPVGKRSQPATASFAPTASDEAVIKATGRQWQRWFELLDEGGAANRSHTETARWLTAEQGVANWWAQSITVSYQRARGLRAPGQHPSGWAISATKTVGAPVERLFAAFEDEALRERWLPGVELRLRTATPPQVAHYDWEDGSTRVHVFFERLAETKSRLAIQHERLPDAGTAEEMKALWRGRVAALKTLLEGGSGK